MCGNSINLENLINYLPVIFHEEAERETSPSGGDESESSPLRALLKVIRDNFAPIGEKIDFIANYFDVYRAPAGTDELEPDFLSWLGSWLLFVPRAPWPEQKKRYAVSIAADL
ncbi:MAG: hypothetical protein GY940_22375, partial [bacterium]|nr:hypothetical protein [bacterium]